MKRIEENYKDMQKVVIEIFQNEKEKKGSYGRNRYLNLLKNK